MSKKLLKILSVTVAVALVICCCCFSASAATINAGTGNQVFVGYDSNAGPVINGNQNANGSYWINYYAGRTDTDLGLLFPIDLVISRGDIVKWSSFYTNFYFSLSSTTTVSLSLGLMDDYYTFYTLEDRVYSSNMSGSFDAQFLGGSKQFTEDIDAKYICIMLNGYYMQTSAGTFAWYPYSFKLSSADENTIMIEGMISEQQKTNDKLDDLNSKQEETNELLGDITADKYTPPSGQDKMDEFADQEEELNQSAQEGLDDAGNLFAGFDISSFVAGLGGIVTIYNHIIPEMPWLNTLLTVSLSLGLFAFLLGMTATLISVSGRGRSAEGSEGRHDAKYIKRDGIASHRPSRK